MRKIAVDFGDADQPGAAPAGDVNGDGSDDWYAFVDGDVASVKAISGATGAPLWAKPLPGLAPRSYVTMRSTASDWIR